VSRDGGWRRDSGGALCAVGAKLRVSSHSPGILLTNVRDHPKAGIERHFFLCVVRMALHRIPAICREALGSR
jgi:hypothetical protein